jgi:hypothetical protein
MVDANALKGMTPEQVLALIAKMERETAEAKQAAENAKKAADAPIRFRVADAGGISCLGLQGWPITLYREQWERLTSADSIKALQTAFREAGESLKKRSESHIDYWKRIGKTDAEIAILEAKRTKAKDAKPLA